MDQRIAFEERPQGLALPELQRLRAEALYATNSLGPADSTRLSLPALTTGRQVTQAWPASANELSVSFADSLTPLGWAAQPNVFSLAHGLGVPVGIVGWFHPYARLFGPVAACAEWYPYPPFEQARSESFGGAMCDQIWAMAPPLQQRRLLVRLYRSSLEDSLRMVADAHFGLVFLHLAVPHTPGIYVPATGKFTLTTFSNVQGYFDNLLLSDRALGILRQAMEQAGLWDKTWLLVSSDHWWRGARRYDGRIDHRVPFLLKPPGPASYVPYPAPFNTRLTSDLILDIFRGQLTNTDSVVEWLDAHRQESVTPVMTAASEP
jgi:hypothetical protein